MLEEDHKVEESCAIKNNKEAFSVSLDILVWILQIHVFYPVSFGWHWNDKVA